MLFFLWSDDICALLRLSSFLVSILCRNFTIQAKNVLFCWRQNRFINFHLTNSLCILLPSFGHQPNGTLIRICFQCILYVCLCVIPKKKRQGKKDPKSFKFHTNKKQQKKSIGRQNPWNVPFIENCFFLIDRLNAFVSSTITNCCLVFQTALSHIPNLLLCSFLPFALLDTLHIDDNEYDAA